MVTNDLPASRSNLRRRLIAGSIVNGGASLIALIAPASFAAARAQEPPPQPPANTLGDIVVTASKRESNIQKTPFAITALSKTTLEQAHVVDAVDLNGKVPSLVITTSEGFNRSVAIRGIGFNVPQNDSAQPSVSYHVDGIYIANPVALNTGFLDVSRVEIVRGPQGTVYGQNSTGGTLNVVNNLPTLDRLTGDAKLDVGNFNLVQFEGALNLPLSPTFAVRAAGQIVHHDGFVNATKVPGTNGHYDIGNERSAHARLSALWQPADRFSLMLRAEYARANNHNTQGKSIYDPDPDPWRQSSDWPGKIRYRNEIYTGTAKYELPFATLKALGSYQVVSQSGSINEDGLDLPLSIQIYGVPGYDAVHDIEYLFHKSRSFTGEVNISSPTGKRFEWIVGAFYLSTRYNVGYDQYAVNSYPIADQPTSLPNQLFDHLTSEDQLGTGDFNFFPYFYSLTKLTRESYSLYGQATYHLADTLRFTGGLRQTHDHNSNNGINYTDQPFQAAATAKALTGKVGLEFDLARKVLAYGSFSTGFKPGGGNISANTIKIGLQYQPERIKAYEVGLKATLLDNKARINLAGFYYNYRNLQYEAEDSVAYQGGVANIPKAYVYGIEAEASLILPYGLRFDGSLTYERSKLNSHYLALDNVIGYAADKLVFAANPPNAIFTDPAVRDQDIAVRSALFSDVYGNDVPNLPRVTAHGTLSYVYKADDGGSLTASATGEYRSSYINTVFGDTIEVKNGRSYHVYKVPGYFLLDLFVGYQFPRSQFSLSVAIKNVANNDAVLGQFTNQFGGETTRQYTPPRQIIGSIGYKF